MQKKNKILMMAISSHLCLTLISSCLVSGIFAKFVTKGTVNAPITFKKLGVTVDLKIDEAKLKRVLGDDYISVAELEALSEAERNAAKATKVWLETSTDDQIKAGVNTVTIHNLALKPGDDLTGYNQELGDEIYDLVQFTIGGTANVDCRVTIDADFVYDSAAFVYASDGTRYMPLRFTCSLTDVDNNTTSSIFYDINLNRGYYALEHAWITNFPLYMTGNMKYNYIGELSPDYYTYRDFSAGSAIELKNNTTNSSPDDDVVIRDVGFGLLWPFSANKDIEDTIIADKTDAKIDVSFTVLVEQIQLS